MKTLKVGDKVTSFISKDQNGNTVRLADYAGKKLIVFSIPRRIHQVARRKLVICVIIIKN